MNLIIFLRFGKVTYIGFTLKKNPNIVEASKVYGVKLEFQSHFQFEFVIDRFVTNTIEE